ncbi:guanylate kinase [bacterium SCSIO 12741]|nr:guanylate kinase [bacterium SCSIO 12741]
MLSGKAIIFSAPSGSGKTTLVHHLLDNTDLPLSFSISATSRPCRGEEQNGKDYHFLSPDEFRSKAANGDFVEWEEVYPNQMYGTLKSEIDRIWLAEKVVIFDVDVIGGLNLKRYFGDQALSLFVQPPSKEELGKRLRGRGTETEEKIQMRLAKAERELAYANQFDKLLINDNLDDAKKQAYDWVSKFLES